MANDLTVGAARQPATVPEFGLAGSVIKSRYRVNAVSSVDRDVVVFSAEDTRHDRPIALKVLRGEFARDAEFVAAVRAQSRTLAKSAHVLRGVQRVYESGDTETGQLFVALEWVEGATLSDVLDTGGALAVPTALRVAIRVGEALEALHHNGLVHGRLGPHSVVMVKDGERIRLVGAELAAAYRTPLGRRIHDPFTPSYPAPEEAGRGAATEATDVYALGMLLRQLLTAGKEDQTAGAATPPLSPAIRRIITTALEPRPERRYSDISVMVNDIWGAAALVTERESRGRPVKAWRNSRHRVRRRRGRFALQMAAVVAAAGVAAAMVWVAGLDRLATQLYSRVTQPAVTAVQVERDALPPSEAPPSTAPRELTVPPSTAPRELTAPPESGVAADKSPVEPRASVVVPESRAVPPPTMAPRVAPSAIAPSTIDGRPRAIVESAVPVAPRAHRLSTELPAPVKPADSIERREPTEPPRRLERGADTSDGSAAVDWLLKDRR